MTESVLEDVKEWQNRPLDVCYPVVFFDALRVKIRSGTCVKAMAVHLALGIKTDGSRDALGMWFNENDGASFWASVFTELKNRGVEEILIAVTDGLKGMTEALATVFPVRRHLKIVQIRRQMLVQGVCKKTVSKDFIKLSGHARKRKPYDTKEKSPIGFRLIH